MLHDDNDNFETHDLALVATLVERGHTPVDLDKSNERRVVFIFYNSIGLRTLIDEYWLDEVKVNPKTYFDTLKHVKTRIYAR